MRVGLLGDIHGNAAALGAVLAAARHRGIEVICSTGDYVGYYYEPKAVLEMLSKWRLYSVRGNHEDMYLQSRSNQAIAKAYSRKYGSGILCAIRQISEEQQEFISGLPRTLTIDLDGKSLLLAHGSPWDTDCYIYPDADESLLKRVAEEQTDYVVLGHTHYRFARRVGKTLVINPGSVGQPRDRQPGAAWAILDTEDDSVEHCTERYDIAALAARAQAEDPDVPYLWSVLTRE